MQHDPTTEARNPASTELDSLGTLELVQLINREDAGVAAAVAAAAASIAAAVDVIATRLENGGRLVYLGAGTSGRLGVLDASECVPTFSCAPDQVIGLIAGGDRALREAMEGAEDLREAAAHDLANIGLDASDVVVGIASSGSTPYVLGGLDYARELGAAAIGLSCNAASPMEQHADLTINVVVGPEVLTGSTRMKAGTATKMVLNTLSTGAMVKLGKTYGNLMVDLRASNEKLQRRTRRILVMLGDLDEAAANRLLAECNGELKTAVVAARLGLPAAAARERLESASGRLRLALEVHDE